MRRIRRTWVRRLFQRIRGGITRSRFGPTLRVNMEKTNVSLTQAEARILLNAISTVEDVPYTQTKKPSLKNLLGLELRLSKGVGQTSMAVEVNGTEATALLAAINHILGNCERGDVHIYMG